MYSKQVRIEFPKFNEYVREFKGTLSPGEYICSQTRTCSDYTTQIFTSSDSNLNRLTRKSQYIHFYKNNTFVGDFNRSFEMQLR